MTILRKAEHTALSSETLHGSIIDLGGHANSEYVRFLKGNFTRTTANLALDAEIKCDFEKPLPIPSSSYDGALLINVLEHIFEYRQLLEETARILKPNGKIVIVVPFLFPYHPSPNDYHRYTAAALERALQSAGFSEVHITPLGTGIFAARWLFIERLLPAPLRFLSLVMVPLTVILDRAVGWTAQKSGKKYRASDYAIGFKATAQK